MRLEVQVETRDVNLRMFKGKEIAGTVISSEQYKKFSKPKLLDQRRLQLKK